MKLRLICHSHSDALEKLSQLQRYDFSNIYVIGGLKALLECTIQKATETRFSAYRTTNLHDEAPEHWRSYKQNQNLLDPGRGTEGDFYLLDTPGLWPMSSPLAWLELRSDICAHEKETFYRVLKLLEVIAMESGGLATEEMRGVMHIVGGTLEYLYEVGVVYLEKRVDLMRFYPLAAAEMSMMECFATGSAEQFEAELESWYSQSEDEDL